jgi:hypothetical protein
MLLISIIGDFHSSIFPLYNELKDQITHHIVVNDDAFSERKKHTQIIKSLKKFNKERNLSIKTEAFTIDEDSQASIERLIQRIDEIEPDSSKVAINITDGLANIGLLLSMKLLARGTQFLSYDMFENSYNITTKDGMKNITLQTSLSIVEHFKLKGLKVEVSQDINFAHKYKREILELFNNYADELELLNKDISKQKVLKTKKYPQAYQLIKNMKLDFVTDAKIITGGLFEYYVFLLLKDLPFDDIEVGLVTKQPLSKKIDIVNEFDILLMKNNHLHMIECKFKKNNKKNELIYKYASLIHIIDDDSQIMIVTNEQPYKQNIYNEQKNTLGAHRRGYLHNIALRGSIINHKSEFLDEIKTHFLN